MSPVEYFVILTIYFCFFAFAINGGDQVRQLVTEWCPYTKFCHTDAQKVKPNSTKEPCCQPCYCDDDCWILDNCCPDKELMNESRPPIVPCIDSHSSRSRDSNPIDGFYRVIDSCPSLEGISYLEMKCSRNKSTSVEDLIWVSDKTGRIYQNIHCAKCHGINDTIPWLIKTTCYNIMKANFVNLMEALLSAECNTINTVPEDIEHITAKYKCYDPSKLIYTSCNESGLMTHYDLEVETACEQSGLWPFAWNMQLTKNIICLMCNQDMSTPTASYGGLCNFHNIRHKDTLITFLIDYKSTAAEIAEEESKCGIDEILDESLGLCRKVLCPIGTAPFYGGCKQMVSQINGLIISVQYYLDVIWNTDGLFTVYAHYITAQFMESLDLNSDCNVCRKMIDMTEGNESASDLILVIAVEFTAKCDYGLALTQMVNMRGKVIEVHINGKAALTILVRSDKQPMSFMVQGSFQTIFLDSSCTPDYALLFGEMICPRLELNYTELELFSESKRREKDIFASFFRSSETHENISRVSVCLENYFSSMSLNRTNLSDCKFTLLILLAELFFLTVSNIS